MHKLKAPTPWGHCKLPNPVIVQFEVKNNVVPLIMCCVFTAPGEGDAVTSFDVVDAACQREDIEGARELVDMIIELGLSKPRIVPILTNQISEITILSVSF